MRFICMTTGLKRRTISRAKRSTVFVKIHISSREPATGIEWDNGFLKAVIIQQKMEVIIAVESGVGGKTL